ncbi:MAG: lipoprotein-releasing ABC transporter permease subunit [Thalassotalea sp.]
MFQPVSLFIGLRYSRSRNRSGFVSFITFFSITGILLGVASLITVVSVMNGFEGELKKRILGIVPHVVLSSTDQQHIDDWQSLVAQAQQLEHVDKVTPLVSAEALVQSSSNLNGVLIQGIDPEFEQDGLIANSLIAGSWPYLTERPYSIVIGQTLAYKLNATLYDNIRLVLPNHTRFTPMGRMPIQRTFTVVGIFNVGSQVDDSVVYINSLDANKLMRMPANSFNELRFYLDDAFNANKVVDAIQGRYQGISISSWQQTQGALFAAVSMEKNMMWLMLSLIVAVAAFNIVSALVMVVIEKQGEIGILQTLGLSRFSILKVFLTQGMFNGVFGASFGVVLGLLITFYLNDVLALLGLNLFGAGYATQQLPIEFLWQDLMIIVIGALCMTFIASLYPAYCASKTQPAEVLRNE